MHAGIKIQRVYITVIYICSVTAFDTAIITEYESLNYMS